jgi:hypothetical protein
MGPKYIVELTSEERIDLEALVGKGTKAPAYKIKHAHIHLNVDVTGPNIEDLEVAGIFRLPVPILILGRHPGVPMSIGGYPFGRK